MQTPLLATKNASQIIIRNETFILGKYFIEYFKIDCLPRVVNVFDETKLPQCNEEDGDKYLKTLLSASYQYSTIKCNQCLDPCSKTKYSFKV